MISQLASSGVRVPGGFATTAQAYRDFLAHNGLADRINAMLARSLTWTMSSSSLALAKIRQLIVDTPFPAQLEAEIRTAYDQMVADSGAAHLGGRALFRHRRRLAGRFVRRSAKKPS